MTGILLWCACVVCVCVTSLFKNRPVANAYRLLNFLHTALLGCRSLGLGNHVARLIKIVTASIKSANVVRKILRVILSVILTAPAKINELRHCSSLGLRYMYFYQ